MTQVPSSRSPARRGDSDAMKAARLRDGGLHSPNCKCGRAWDPSWGHNYDAAGYVRVCPQRLGGCSKKIRECECPLYKNKKKSS